MANEHEKVHVICENLCLEEGMTKEQIEAKFATKEVVNSLASGSPKGTYATATALVNANPDTGVYVVTGNGHIYSWTKNQSEDPVDLGVYQATGIEYGSISNEYIQDEAITPEKIKGHSILNIFDKNSSDIMTDARIYNNGTVHAEGGSGFSVTGFIQVQAGATYYFTPNVPYNRPAIAFYDNNKNHISNANSGTDGWNTLGAKTIPDGCHFIKITYVTSGKDRVGIYTSSTAPTIFIPYDSKFSIEKLEILNENIENGSITDEKIAINALNPSKIKGAIVNVLDITSDEILTDTRLGDTGSTVGISGYSTTGFIEVQQNATYFTNLSMPGNYPMVCFYDKNKAFLSKIYSTTELNVWKKLGAFVIPSNAYYMRVSSTTGGITGRMLGSGPSGIYTSDKSPLEYIDYGVAVLDDVIIKDKTIIINMKADGSGDFATLREALESTNTIDTYIINLDEGTYDVLADYTSEEISAAVYSAGNIRGAFCGPYVDGNITLRGTGDVDKTIIKGYLSNETYSNNTLQQISTLNLQGNVTLENLTVTSEHLRYPIHDDFTGSVNKTITLKNCKIISIKNSDGTSRTNAYGMGTRSGKKTICTDCYFEPQFYQHNNYNFTKPAVTILTNCVCTSQIVVHDLNSGANDKVILNNCNTPIVYYSYYSTSVTQPSVEIICNNSLPIIYKNRTKYLTKDITYVMALSPSGISKGTLIKRTGNLTYAPMTSSDTKTVFFGIAIEDIDYQKFGRVQFSNYIKASDYGLTANVGDKFTISNGSLVTTTGNEYVGYCDLEDYIKLCTH